MNDILQYKNYYASVHFSAGDEVFYGKLLGINDLVNFEGSLVKELKKPLKKLLTTTWSYVRRLAKPRKKPIREHLM